MGRSTADGDRIRRWRFEWATAPFVSLLPLLVERGREWEELGSVSSLEFWVCVASRWCVWVCVREVSLVRFFFWVFFFGSLGSLYVMIQVLFPSLFFFLCSVVCGCVVVFFFSSSLSKLSAPTSDRSNSPRNFDLLQLDRASLQPLPGLSQFPLDPAPTSPLPACPHLSSQLPLDLARLRFRFTPASPFLQLRFDPQLAPPGLRSAILPVSSAPSIHPACFFCL